MPNSQLRFTCQVLEILKIEQLLGPIFWFLLCALIPATSPSTVVLNKAPVQVQEQRMLPTDRNLSN